MVQSIKHGIGKDDHTYTTYKGLNSRMPDDICQKKFGFDNIELFQVYQDLPELQREELLNNALDELQTYFLTSNKAYTTENKGNLITVTYPGIPKSEREDFGMVISEIMDQIKNRILNFDFNQDYYTTGRMKITFHIKNCGFIPEENSNEMSIQNGSDNREMSIQNKKNSENVNTKPKKESWIQIRVNKDIKNQIKQDAKTKGYTSMSKYILAILLNDQNINTNTKNVLTNNLEHSLLLKFIKIFIEKKIKTDSNTLSEKDIELIKALSTEVFK